MTNTSTAPLRAAIYARISRADKKTPKVENQIAACRVLAADYGYVIPDDTYVYADDGIAASGKAIDDTTLENRPEARRLISDLRDGSIDVLLAVEGERLARTYLDGFEFISASVRGRAIWHLDADGIIDPATDGGEDQAVDIFRSGRKEGKKRDGRQTRRYDRERAAGNPLWGTRPFGYDDDRVTIREPEAALIRQAVVDYLGAKRSMLRIAKDWNAADVKTDGMLPTKADVAAGRTVRMREGRDGKMHPVRGLWTATTVRQLLLRPRNAGIYMHRGVELPKSRIQAIITRPQHEALKARVKSGTPISERAQTLLGGIIRCECGAPMHGTVSYSQRRGGPRHHYQHYKCSQALYDKSRRHTSIVQSTADNLFIAWIWLDLFTGNLDTPGEDVTGELDHVAAQLAENAESIAHVGGLLLDVSMKSVHGQAHANLARLDSEREALEAERDLLLARAAEGGALATFLYEWRQDPGYANEAERVAGEAKFRSMWTSIPLEQRRAMIRARYRPSVALGGRGAGRISPNPIDPSTFAQPIDYDELP